ncbi:MAG TPA: substrate-binding domain-containing protein [Acidimicrobiales bacterium]|nr:substrate-binding domain-containing protein [Acidimicrobiales bacterium]
MSTPAQLVRTRGTKRVTTTDIARAAGVSAATVSKVLNGRSEVSMRTRMRVESLLLQQKYERRPPGRGGPPPILDLLLREVGNPWGMEVIRGALEAAAEVGLNVVLSVLPDGARGCRWLDQICARGSRGIIVLLARLTDTDKAAVRARGLPLAVIEPRGEPDPNVATVVATNWAGGYAATRHLLELGHERIGIISGPQDLLCSHVRMSGYCEALKAGDLPLDGGLVRWGDFDVDAVFEQAIAMLSMADRPTAIFAGSDLQAMGVFEAARLQQLSVPAQLSVVGFDDLPQSRWMSPPLTTVRQPLAEMAARAVRLVLEQGHEEQKEGRSVEVATTLVVRDSTGPPPLGRRRSL